MGQRRAGRRGSADDVLDVSGDGAAAGRAAGPCAAERIWPGIAVYNQSLSAAESKIRDCRAAGLDGLSIYSYNSRPAGDGSLARVSQTR